MSPYDAVRRASIAELTPPKKYIGNYAAKVARVAYDFQDIPLSWGIEVYGKEDLYDGSPKRQLISFLAKHGFWSEVHLNDDALKDVLLSKTIEDSEIAQALATIGHGRTIFNLNADYSEIFNPASPSELQFYLSKRNFFKRGRHTTVLLFNDVTSNMVNGALRHYIKANSIKKNVYDLGLMFCPENPTEVSYKEFKSPEKYDCHYGLISDIKYEHCGGLGSRNIYDALTHMAEEGIHSKEVTTRGGVMKNGELDFREVRKFLSKIRAWQNDFCVEVARK